MYQTDGDEKCVLKLCVYKTPFGKSGHIYYMLKSCLTEIALILEAIFKQSLNTGELPSDWLTANICSVFNKGNCSYICSMYTLLN